MPKKKPAPPKKQTPMEKMIEECVKKAKARKKSGETDQTWREQYAQTLKVPTDTAPLSATPFDGSTTKKARDSR
jgi:hypothetical protein